MSDLPQAASSPSPAQDTGTAAQRSRMYALLAEAFTFPDGETSARLLSGELQEALNETVSLLELPVSALIPGQLPADKVTLPELQTLYTRLFEVGSGSASVSSVERSYGGGPSQKLWEKLLRFYTFFGLDFSQGSASEQPDHLLTQLAFMHYLCFLEAGLHGSGLDIRRGQRDFLVLHLGRWAADFSRNLEKQKDAEPYSGFGRLLAVMAATDLQQLELCLASE